MTLRHDDFVKQTADGVDQLKTDNFDLWQWQNRMRDQPGFWSTVGNAAVGLAKGAYSAGEQISDVQIRGAMGDFKDAAQQGADLGLVPESLHSAKTKCPHPEFF